MGSNKTHNRALSQGFGASEFEPRFRIAAARDLPHVMRLESTGFAYGIRENEGTFHRRLKAFNDGFIVAEDDQHRLIGYLTSEIWEFQPVPATHAFDLGHDIEDRHRPSATELYISSMTVDPIYRGHRVGRKLFNYSVTAVHEKYSQLKSCILLVNEQWQHARQIYLSEGFVEILVLKEFFKPAQGSPMAGIVMRKPL